ncbi:hypothetical protein [Allomuricauda sp. M10]|uniref:hypothetical protein n=1 Tax=Allomuricauda sp. M10 TaxID=2683292 RepID=UPI001D18CF11|nr:hypothetical protein [Muricauda sp. M10]
MNDRLIINGEDLDLYSNTNINLNLQVGTVADISTRNSTFSNTVDLPRTAKNERLMGMVGTLGNTSRVPYERIGCNYLKGNISLINEGYVHLSQTQPDRYKLNLFDGLINFSEAMGEKSISDLDLVDLNHNLTESVYEGSFANTEGYIYALGDFGHRPANTTPYNIEYQAPSLFVSTVMDRILTQNGFTYEGLPSFTDEVIAPTNGYPIEEGSISTDPIGEVSEVIAWDEIDPVETYHTYDHFWTEDVDIDPDLSLADSNKAIRSNLTGRLKLDIEVDHGFQSASPGSIKISFRKNASYITIINVPVGSGGTINKTVFVEVVNGDDITATVTAISVNDTIDYELQLNYTLTVTISEQTGGQYQDFALMYQDYKQKDLVKDVMQRYCLIPYLKGNHIRFIQMEDLLSDMSNAMDWTQKLVEVKSESYSPPNYAQNNLFEYKYNRDLTEQLYNGSLQVDNETLDLEKTIVTSVNTISKSEVKKILTPLYQMVLWEEDSESNVVEKAHTNTFYKIKKVNGSITYRLFDSGSNENFNGDVPYLSYENVSYQYYLDNYYTRFNWLLDSYKEIEVELSLSPIDLTTVDFFKLVFLKQTGRYYLLDSIRTSTTTTAKLIEITRFN